MTSSYQAILLAKYFYASCLLAQWNHNNRNHQILVHFLSTITWKTKKIWQDKQCIKSNQMVYVIKSIHYSRYLMYLTWIPLDFTKKASKMFENSLNYMVLIKTWVIKSYFLILPCSNSVITRPSYLMDLNWWVQVFLNGWSMYIIFWYQPCLQKISWSFKVGR